MTKRRLFYNRNFYNSFLFCFFVVPNVFHEIFKKKFIIAPTFDL